MNFGEFNNKFANIYNPILRFEDKSLPLCAAETSISDFVRYPLLSFVQEKYILGSVINYTEANFIGSRSLFEVYGLLTELCEELFHCSYADGRTLTGVNTISTLLMSLFEIGDSIYITSPEYGGHSSMPKICKRLGIHVIEMPYDIENMDFCYDEINKKIKEKNIKGILVCLSDMLFQPDLSQIDLSSGTILIYDATQVLGLIAAEKLPNFFDTLPKDLPFILTGSTHKTLPGPTNGIVLTNSKELMHQLDTKINPDYLRNIQMHQILSLIFCLEEFSIYGKEYMNAVVESSNALAKLLRDKNFDVINRNSVYSNTHQIFIHLPHESTHAFYMECQLYNITLNERYRKIYKDSGIRLGVQQIARYGWKNKELEIISEIFEMINQDCLAKTHSHYQEISNLIAQLAKDKHLKFTLDISNFLEFFVR